MQSCYGPPEAMKTAIAAYTPNTTWMSNKDKPYYTRTGGGTSSATPQIAAAVALFLHKNREFIAQYITDAEDQWKKVELVRKALFDTAEKDTGYDSYYGNGILKANDMLNYEITVDKLPKDEVKLPEDSIGRSGIDDLFRMWRRRSRSEDDNDNQFDSNLREMIALEIEQLIVSNDEFQEFSINDGISLDLKKAILKSNKSSKFLKSIIGRGANSLLRSNNVNLPFLKPIHTANTEDYSMVTYWSNTDYEVNKIEVPNRYKGEIDQSFEIDFEDTVVNANRSLRASLPNIELGFSYDANNDSPIHLIQVELKDGSTKYKWVYANQVPDAQKRGNQTLEAFIPGGEQYISLSTDAQEGKRGIAGWLKKIGTKNKENLCSC